MEIDYKAIVEAILSDMDALNNNYGAIINDRFMSDEEKEKEFSDFDGLFVKSVLHIMQEYGAC